MPSLELSAPLHCAVVKKKKRKKKKIEQDIAPMEGNSQELFFCRRTGSFVISPMLHPSNYFLLVLSCLLLFPVMSECLLLHGRVYLHPFQLPHPINIKKKDPSICSCNLSNIETMSA